MQLLQEYAFIALDRFQQIKQNEIEKKKIESIN